MKNIGDKSISELEGWKWNNEVPLESESYVVWNFYRLHNYPVKNYNLADFRFMIGQETGLEYLVPIALKKLEDDLFIEAELYPGDLFCSLLLINTSQNYWENHLKEKKELIELFQNQKKRLGSLHLNEAILKKIKEEYKAFLEK